MRNHGFTMMELMAVVAVVAIVALEDRPDATAVTDEELLDVAAGHIARYKLPKAIVRRDVLQRSPSGKADYRWAAAQAGA